MITPLFECAQDDATVTVTVRAPYSRPKDIDISVDGCDLHFFCAPYLLHLRFPHPLTLCERHTASYDMDSGLAKITLAKVERGLHFERLDMLSTLLVTRETSRAKLRDGEVVGASGAPGIEVLSSQAASSSAGTTDTVPALKTDSIALGDGNSSSSATALAEVVSSDLQVGAPRYGFGGRYAGVFAARAEDVSEIVELPEPDVTPAQARRRLRLGRERSKFSAEHYAADYMLSSEFSHVLQYECPSPSEVEPLSDAQKDVLLKLPSRQYLSDVDGCSLFPILDYKCASYWFIIEALVKSFFLICYKQYSSKYLDQSDQSLRLENGFLMK